MAASSKKHWLRRLSFLAVPVFIVGLMGLVFLGVDQLCVNDANRRLPYYPNALRVQETHNGLRVRGMGNSLVLMHSEDSSEEVEAWFEEQSIKLLKSGRTRGLNTLSHWLGKSEEGKTEIYYLSQCVM
jgi:hypothetical protein